MVTLHLILTAVTPNPSPHPPRIGHTNTTHALCQHTTILRTVSHSARALLLKALADMQEVPITAVASHTSSTKPSCRQPPAWSYNPSHNCLISLTLSLPQGVDAQGVGRHAL